MVINVFQGGGEAQLFQAVAHKGLATDLPEPFRQHHGADLGVILVRLFADLVGVGLLVVFAGGRHERIVRNGHHRFPLDGVGQVRILVAADILHDDDGLFVQFSVQVIAVGLHRQGIVGHVGFHGGFGQRGAGHHQRQQQNKKKQTGNVAVHAFPSLKFLTL